MAPALHFNSSKNPLELYSEFHSKCRGAPKKEMIEEYLAHHFEPKPNDRFDIEPYKPAAQPAGVAGLSVRDLKPTDLQSVGV